MQALVFKKMSVYLYLLKAISSIQWDFRVPKLNKVEDDKILTPPILQNVTSYFLQSVNFFSKYLTFFLLIERSHWFEQNILKKLWSKNLLFQSPWKMYKMQTSNFLTSQTIHIFKKPLIEFFWFLHEVKWLWILKTDRFKILNKKISPLAGGWNGPFRSRKGTFWKKALKCLIRFFLFWESF